MRTPGFTAIVIGTLSLDLLECSYVTEYLRERRGLASISDEQAQVLCQAVAGNPQVMGMIGDNLEQAARPKPEQRSNPP